MQKDILNIAELCYSSENLGPGKRFIIWVQGCPFNCANCIAKEFIPFEKANVLYVEQLAKIIISQKEINGITISGGEPMMQAENLAKLLYIVLSERPKLDVIVFTGFEMQKINNLRFTKKFIDYIDVLITGLYVDSLNDGKGMKGSINQKTLFLTDKLIEQKKYFENYSRNLEMHVREDNYLVIGIPKKDFKKN